MEEMHRARYGEKAQNFHTTLPESPCVVQPRSNPNPVFLDFSVQSVSRVQLFATPWTAACQAALSIGNSWSLLKLMSMESLMPPNHLILCHPLFLLPSIFPSIRVFSSESVLHIRCQSIGVSASTSVLPMNIQG